MYLCQSLSKDKGKNVKKPDLTGVFFFLRTKNKNNSKLSSEPYKEEKGKLKHWKCWRKQQQKQMRILYQVKWIFEKEGNKKSFLDKQNQPAGKKC